MGRRPDRLPGCRHTNFLRSWVALERRGRVGPVLGADYVRVWSAFKAAGYPAPYRPFILAHADGVRGPRGRMTRHLGEVLAAAERGLSS
jgi:hypothetical protein